MKLVSIFLNARTKALAVCFLLAVTAQARVFWNKFEVYVNEKNEVIMTWNVTEYNNKSFRIQHSTDGLKWEDIALVQSKNSAESMTDYTYTVSNKLKGKHFYRLQDLDIDHGTTGYSPVRTLVINNDKKEISLWPNPATTEISFAGHDSDNSAYTKAQVFDLTGRMLIEKQVSESSNTISIKDLQPGTYVIRILHENGKIHNEKFVKQ